MYTQPQKIGEVTIYSDQYEPSCPYCQSGAHSSTTETNFGHSAVQFAGANSNAQVTRGRVVYTTPERIVSQKIVEGVALSPMQLRQQQILTPPRQIPVAPQVIQTPPIAVRQSPIVVQQSPIIQQSPVIVNRPPIVYQQQQSPIVVQQPQIQIQQSPIAIQQQAAMVQQSAQQQSSNQQALITQTQITQEQKLIQAELAQKLQQQKDELSQQQYAYYQLQKAYEEQKEAYFQLQQTLSTQTHTQFTTNFIPAFLQTVQYKVTTKDGAISTRDEVELYWRHKVFELEEQIYSLWEQINQKKQKRLNPAARSDDQNKIDQLQTEVNQMEHILRLKSNSIVQLRNKLNDMMYQFDPATEATREQDQQLQQLRQRVMQLSSKFQEIQDEVQMAEAQTETIRNGKGFKFVSVTQTQQTTSQVRQTQNSVRTTSQQQLQQQQFTGSQYQQ